MAVGQLGTVMMRMGVDTRAWYKGLGEAQRSLVTFGASMQVAGMRMTTLFTTAIAGVGGIALKASKDWETAFTGVRKTLEASEPQFKLLNEGFRTMAKTVPQSAAELARLGEIAGQLGIEAGGMLGFVKIMTDLGTATEDLPAEEAAFKIAQMMTVMETSTDRVGELGAVIVRLGNNLKTTEGRIVNMAELLASTGNIIGLTESQVLALAGGLSAVGIKAERGGTAMMRVMIAIDKAVDTSSESLGVFAAVSGKTAEGFKKAWEEDAGKALVSFIKGLKNVKDSSHSVFALLDQLNFSNVRVGETLQRISGGVKELEKAFNLAADEVTKQTALIIEAERRYETLDSRLGILKNILWDVAISLGDALRPALENVINLVVMGAAAAEKLVDWFANLDEKTRTLIVDVAVLVAILGPLMVGFGAVISLMAAFSGPIMLAITGFVALGGAFIYLKSAGYDLSDVIVFLGEAFVELGALPPKLGASLAGLIWKLKEFAQSAYVAATATLALSGEKNAMMELGRIVSGTSKAYNALETSTKHAQQVFLRAMDTIRVAERDLSGIRDKFILLAATAKDTKGLESFKDAMEEALGEIQKGLDELGDSDKAIEDTTSNLGDLGDAFDTVGKKAKEAFKFIGTEAKALQLATQTREDESLMMGVTPSRSGELKNTIAQLQETYGHSVLEMLDYNAAVTASGVAWDETGEKMEEVTVKGVKWSSVMRDLTRAFKLLGIDANSTLGRILGSMAVAASAGENFKKALGSIRQEVGGEMVTSWGHVAQAVMSAVEAGAAFISVLDQAGKGARTLGAAMTGMQIGMSMGGGWGALIGLGVGAIVGALHTPAWEKAMQEVGQNWGETISEEMARAISDTAKELDLTNLEASLMHFGGIIREMGGMTDENAKYIATKVSAISLAINNGVLTMEQGLGALDDAFAASAESWESLGVAGAYALAQMIKQMEALGTVTESALAFINERARSAIENLTGYFDQFIDKSGRAIISTIEEATNVVTMMGMAFSAALKATGSLYEAILMMPEAFEALRVRLGELLGTENELFNAISQYYNFVADNSKQLAAINGLMMAFKDLIAINVINRETIGDFADVFHTSWLKLVADSGDLNTSLMMMGPQIGMLYRAFQQMGVDVPTWLSDIYDQAVAVGANMAPPRSTTDLLGQIARVLWDIADSIGAITQETRDLYSTGGPPAPGTGSGPSGTGGGGKTPAGGGERMASGFEGVFNTPTTALFGEAGPEYVYAEPLDGSSSRGGGMGGGGLTVNVDLSNTVVGDPYATAQMIGEAVAIVIEENESGALTKVKEGLDRRA